MQPATNTPRNGSEPSVSAGMLAAGLFCATAWSLLRKGYQFDGWFADDQFWNALLIERMNPGLLANDPIVALIGDRYQSALFEVIEVAAPAVGLPGVSLVLFLTARLLACFAIHRLALTLTGSPWTGLVSAFLLAGAPLSYLGGINFVETILTPRGFALPLCLLALDAFFRGRAFQMAAWAAAGLLVHPVSGVNLLGALVFCGLCFGGGGDRRSFWSAIALSALPLAFVGWWTGVSISDGGPLRFDPEWAGIVEHTVGPWVYLHLTPGNVWFRSLWLPLLGCIAIAYSDRPALRSGFLHFAAAAVAALSVHALLVDLLQLRLLLQASPQRSTVAFAAIAIVAVADWIRRSLLGREFSRRAFALAFLIAAIAFKDPSLSLLFGFGLAALGSGAVPPRSVRIRSALAGVSIAALLVFAGPGAFASFEFRPGDVAGRVERLLSLGVDRNWATVQRALRERSRPGDRVMAPAADSPRVFAQRPSTMRTKMQSFTHVSKPFALRYAAWNETVGRHLASADAREKLALARASQAKWLVVDDRSTPERPSDPAPKFRVGPYRAFELPDPVVNDAVGIDTVESDATGMDEIGSDAGKLQGPSR